MDFDILGVSISDDSLNDNEMRNGNAQDPGERFLSRVVLSNIFFNFHLNYLTCIFLDYRYRKDELFKRLKVTTFAQLVSEE